MNRGTKVTSFFISMSQPVSGAQYFSLGTVGTTVIVNQPATLVRIVIPGTYVGSVTIHDSSSAAGTSATSPIVILGIPALNIFRSIEVGAQFKKGIVTEATGGPIMTLVWDK